MKLIRLLTKVSYGGQNKTFFKEQRNRIAATNCALMSKFCYAISFILFFAYVGSFFLSYLAARSTIFIVAYVVFVALALLMGYLPKRNITLSRYLFFVYIFIIYIFGFLVGITYEFGYDGIIFNALTILVPVVFTISVFAAVAFLVPIHVLYYVFCFIFLPETSVSICIIHALVCLLSSLIIHSFVLSSKVYVLAVNEQLRMMCEIDELTQLPNRRSFNQFISSAFAPNANLNLAIADIDNFKDYNDHYGHLGGDEVLVSVSEKFADFADTNSIFVARYGGEEFVFVDNRHTPSEFAKLLNDLNNSIYNLNLENAQSPHGRISLSIGIASRDSSADYESLIVNADVALYKAKRTGKNCVVSDLV